MEIANGKIKNSQKEEISRERGVDESENASLIGKKFILNGKHDNKKQKKKNGGYIGDELSGHESGQESEGVSEGEV